MPEAQVGELLVIECAGAYSAVMGSNYNSKPLAGEILITDGQPQMNVTTFQQVELGYSEKLAIEEAARCFRCDLDQPD